MDLKPEVAMNIKKRLVGYLIVLCGAVVLFDASAQTLSTRLSTSVYSWENQYADSTTQKSFRGYQTAIFHANGIWKSNISLHGYVTGSYDLAGARQDNPDYRVYNLYAQWKSDPTKNHRWEARVGRQQVYAGVRAPSIDGVRYDFYNADKYGFMAYYGALPPADGTVKMGRPADRSAFGAKVMTSKLAQTHMALTYVERRSIGQYYYTINERNADTLVYSPDLDERLIAFDANRNFFGKINWFYNVTYDALASNVRKISTDVQFQPLHTLWFAVQYAYRRPDLYYNTIFAKFDDIDANQELWVRGTYQFNTDWSFNGEYANVFYKMKDAWRYGAGLTYQRTNVSYQWRLGYGGTIKQISLSSYYPVRRNMYLYGGLTYATYDMKDDITSSDFSSSSTQDIYRQVYQYTNSSMTAVLRCNYNLMQAMNVDVEGQYLSQNIKTSPVFAGSKYDLRFFVRANYWFFNKI